MKMVSGEFNVKMFCLTFRVSINDAGSWLRNEIADPTLVAYMPSVFYVIIYELQGHSAIREMFKQVKKYRQLPGFRGIIARGRSPEGQQLAEKLGMKKYADYEDGPKYFLPVNLWENTKFEKLTR